MYIYEGIREVYSIFDTDTVEKSFMILYSLIHIVPLLAKLTIPIAVFFKWCMDS